MYAWQDGFVDMPPYPPNFMPPFALPEVENDSLTLYTHSLDKPE